jgi:hypothetical protein
MARVFVLAAALLLASAGQTGARVTPSVHTDRIVAPRAERSRPAVAPGTPGSLLVVPGRTRVSGPGRVLRFAVEVEGGLPVDRSEFAAQVVDVLSHPRSWGGRGAVAFQRVRFGPVDFRITLVSPTLTDDLCAPLLTNGIYSCAQAGRAVLNASRWLRGAAAYGRRLHRYRVYMVNHEVGHLLGRGHAFCPAAGAPAPVMVQQTKGVAPCRPNPWPLAWERN